MRMFTTRMFNKFYTPSTSENYFCNSWRRIKQVPGFHQRPCQAFKPLYRRMILQRQLSCLWLLFARRSAMLVTPSALFCVIFVGRQNHCCAPPKSCADPDSSLSTRSTHDQWAQSARIKVIYTDELIRIYRRVPPSQLTRIDVLNRRSLVLVDTRTSTILGVFRFFRLVNHNINANAKVVALTIAGRFDLRQDLWEFWITVRLKAQKHQKGGETDTSHSLLISRCIARTHSILVPFQHQLLFFPTPVQYWETPQIQPNFSNVCVWSQQEVTLKPPSVRKRFQNWGNVDVSADSSRRKDDRCPEEVAIARQVLFPVKKEHLPEGNL